MAAGTYAEYLVALTSSQGVPQGTYNHGLKILYGEKIFSMTAAQINAERVDDLINLLPGAGTNADDERAWLIARGAPVGTIADMRQFLVLNSMMP
jgi:hypothetical protein